MTFASGFPSTDVTAVEVDKRSMDGLRDLEGTSDLNASETREVQRRVKRILNMVFLQHREKSISAYDQ